MIHFACDVSTNLVYFLSENLLSVYFIGGELLYTKPITSHRIALFSAGLVFVPFEHAKKVSENAIELNIGLLKQKVEPLKDIKIEKEKVETRDSKSFFRLYIPSSNLSPSGESRVRSSSVKNSSRSQTASKTSRSQCASVAGSIERSDDIGSTPERRSSAISKDISSNKIDIKLNQSSNLDDLLHILNFPQIKICNTAIIKNEVVLKVFTKPRYYCFFSPVLFSLLSLIPTIVSVVPLTCFKIIKFLLKVSSFSEYFEWPNSLTRHSFNFFSTNNTVLIDKIRSSTFSLFMPSFSKFNFLSLDQFLPPVDLMLFKTVWDNQKNTSALLLEYYSKPLAEACFSNGEFDLAANLFHIAKVDPCSVIKMYWEKASQSTLQVKV